MRRQLKNTGSALLLQVVTFLVGLIIPRLMIKTFGSEMYGLSNSVAQFLSYITLLEIGVGGVVRAALYKRFAQKDVEGVSRIIRATEVFFRKIALIFLAYVIILAVAYPLVINDTFSFLFTASLIVIISLSSIAQYCFGITYTLFLRADQKNYVPDCLQIITCILNAGMIFVLIVICQQLKLNTYWSFLIVMFGSALVYILKPLLQYAYVKKNYQLNYKATPDGSALTQKRNAMAHHIAWFLHTGTDKVVITFFGSLSGVAIYSVYYMVASGMTKITTSLVSGMEAKYGNMMSSEGEEKTRNRFTYYTMFTNTAVLILFTTAACMVMPFISIYTSGFKDSSAYYIPLLGFMLILAEASYCLRNPYHEIVTAAGHFKQTQVSAFIEAGINIVGSIVLILFIGLPGVAIATALAMIYRTVFYIVYLSKNILKINLVKNLLRFFGAILFAGAIVAINWFFINIPVDNYLWWAVEAVVVVLVCAVMSIIYNVIFFKKQTFIIVKSICKKLFRKKNSTVEVKQSTEDELSLVDEKTITDTSEKE